MQVRQLRNEYLDYFENNDHQLVPSSPLVPADKSLLFTSAGMVQFKDYFWGRATAPYAKATSCQKCFRMTDVEEVGTTDFHHTFFEMLGNFSFGDYFKHGAIELAWEFLTDRLSLPEDQLWISVYEQDDEAYSIWNDVIGVPADKIVRLGKKHNWWGPVGESGPCGPDSEVFYDRGEQASCGPDCLGVACSCNRFSEIWNLVFIQFDIQQDGTLKPLNNKNIDTGMGLERTAAVLQGVETNFEIDVFKPITQAIEAASQKTITSDKIKDRNVIADHIRGSVALLAEGVMPSNERQGYVLRRILRRAIRASDRLGLTPGKLAQIVDPVVDTLGGTYPEITASQELATKVIAREEETFRNTLREGEQRLQDILEEMTEQNRILPGKTAFELYDTYGFPLEMTEEIAAKQGIVIDKDGFQKEMTRQRKRSRTVTTSVKADTIIVRAGEESPTQFVGNEELQAEGEIRGFYPGDSDRAELVFDQSPFYAETGGQIADTGRIENLSQPGRAKVLDVQKNPQGAFLHHILVADGTFAVGDHCRLIVDAEQRRRIVRNHTGTHILHMALRKVLGEHVVQAGSLVSDKELRFDFSHFEKVTGEEITSVEDIANAVVLENLPVETEEMPLDEAKKSGAIAHFEDEYREKNMVRVVSIDSYSSELCGGTHVTNTGEIGLIKIISEESVASGTRRIRALTGDTALSHFRSLEQKLDHLSEILGEDPEAGINKLHNRIATLTAKIEQLTTDELASVKEELLNGMKKIGTINFIAAGLEKNSGELKQLSDMLEEEAEPAVVLLVGRNNNRGLVVCKTSASVTNVNAGDIVRVISSELGGGGGGGPFFGEGGGPQADNLDDTLEKGKTAVLEALSEEN